MAAMELSSDSSICTKCGTKYGRRKGYFPVSYALLHKGIGYIPVCKACIDSIYNEYLSQCKNSKDAVRQVCRKLDLFWSESVFEVVSRQNATKTMMTQYIAKINTITYAGKSYDDTLSLEGTLWTFGKLEEKDEEPEPVAAVTIVEEPEVEIPEEVKAFWGSGYTPEMYNQLQQRYSYWLSRFPQTSDLDIGTETIIKQACSLELDINRDRAAGKPVDKSVAALNTLLGSLNVKPVQKKQEEADLALSSTPLGVWLYRYETQRPLPEVDDELKDVNGLRKYVFTWMGHLCKMLGIKNAYSQLYEDEVQRLRVEHPEYDGDEDDETFMSEVFEEDDAARNEDNSGGDG